ncbi:hypothetical protein [Nocardiopsis synnemataformans]|uniref:hypothetical protein n=1 Tax=Nocardiopsis synnemataformans TaxID=61305 RepID=UPI003EBDCA63
MGLREKIAEVIFKHGRPHGDWATYNDQGNHLACADAVMGIVAADAARRRAYTERQVELAREAEANTWKRPLAEEKEGADAELAEQVKAQAVRIGELEAQVRGLTAEVAIHEAAGVDPDETLLTGIGGSPGHGTTVRLRPPEKLMRALVASMIDMLGGAPNYVELDAAHPAHPGRYTVTVQRAEGKTPHALRLEAEADARTARARYRELKEENQRMRADDRETT